MLDLVQDFSLGTPASDFARILRKMPALMYSIGKSPRATSAKWTWPWSPSATMPTVSYCYGTCSIHCAERVRPGDTLPVYVQSNPNFRLPEQY